MRKLLTLNKEAELNCDSLMEDIDYCKVYSREDLGSLITSFIDQFKNTIKQAVQQSGISLEKIDNVELVGDSTRMPIIIESLKEVFGKEELSRTLNSQECIARGCALQAAMLSPNF
jgi:heat shock protein 4